MSRIPRRFSRSLLPAVLLLLPGALSASAILYEGDYGPAHQTPPFDAFPPFGYAIFADTSMTSNGSVLTLSTYYAQGVWFGGGIMGPAVHCQAGGISS